MLDKEPSPRLVVVYLSCTKQSTSLCAIRLCEPWRRSNYIKLNRIRSLLSTPKHPRGHIGKTDVFIDVSNKLLLDPWEPHQASWRINTEQLSGDETNSNIQYRGLHSSRLSFHKCTITLCEQLSIINLFFYTNYSSNFFAEYLHLHIWKKKNISSTKMVQEQ